MKSQNECFFSVDIEASGPAVPKYSMLSLGACLLAEPREQSFYVEIKPLNDNYIQAALDVCKLSMEDLKKYGSDPKEAMQAFAEWIVKVSRGKRPVFIGYNASFDWMFVHWYFMEFLGYEPFGSGALDIASYYLGKTGQLYWEGSLWLDIKKEFPHSGEHTHNALEDAVEQANLFNQIRGICKQKNNEGRIKI